MSLAETYQEHEPRGSCIKTKEPIHPGRMMLSLTQEDVRRSGKSTEEHDGAAVFSYGSCGCLQPFNCHVFIHASYLYLTIETINTNTNDTTLLRNIWVDALPLR